MTNTTGLPESTGVSQPSCSLAYINAIVDTAESLGVEKQILLDSVGLSQQEIGQPNRRIPMDSLLELLNVAANHSDNENFGLHVGPNIKPGSFGLMGYLSMCSRNLRETSEMMLKLRRIAFDAGQTHLHEEGENTVFTWHPLKPVFDRQRYLVDAIFSGWSCFSRLTCGDDLVMCRIDFTYPEPENTTVHQQLFNCEVRFGQAQNRTYIPTHLMDRPQPHANAAIFETLNKQAYTFVQELNARESVLNEVRNSLHRLLPKGNGNIDSVAETLNMNRRTLQRKLSAKSTSFKQLINALREDLAEQYLKDKSLSMLDIALLLGFSDNSSFTTAFKGWKAISPSEYRQKILFGTSLS